MKKTLIAIAVLIIVVIAGLYISGIRISNIALDDTGSASIAQIRNLDKSDFAQRVLKDNGIICINLWASWCMPCIEEMPMLNQVRKAYRPKGVEFLSMSMDKDTTAAANFIKKGRFEFTDLTFKNLAYKDAIVNYLEGRPLYEKSAGQILPVTYLIKNKKVVKKMTGEINKEALIANIQDLLRK